VCGRALESTIIGLIIPESATGTITTFDICRFQGVTALALTTLWKPWVFANNICSFSFLKHCPAVTFSESGTLRELFAFYYDGNDVIAISTVRWRLGVFKMADSESSIPLY
jgi:hypothetical protein